MRYRASDGDQLLPESIVARWNAEDWDDHKMVARRYSYEDAETSGPIELTEAQADQYIWGACHDDLTGGSQAGKLRSSFAC